MDGSVEPNDRKNSFIKLKFLSDLPAYQIQTPEEIVQENIRICALIGKISYSPRLGGWRHYYTSPHSFIIRFSFLLIR